MESIDKIELNMICSKLNGHDTHISVVYKLVNEPFIPTSVKNEPISVRVCVCDVNCGCVVLACAANSFLFFNFFASILLMQESSLGDVML